VVVVMILLLFTHHGCIGVFKNEVSYCIPKWSPPYYHKLVVLILVWQISMTNITGKTTERKTIYSSTITAKQNQTAGCSHESEQAAVRKIFNIVGWQLVSDHG